MIWLKGLVAYVAYLPTPPDSPSLDLQPETAVL